MQYEEGLSTAARPVADADVETRAAFINKTYIHVFLAIAAFTGLEVYFFASGLAERIFEVVARTNWLLVLGAFVLVSWIASRVAHTARSLPAQYLALAGFVAAEALIFVPLLFIAAQAAPGVIESAAIVTMGGFIGLTLVAFLTRKDFSFLRGILAFGGVIALCLIVGGVIFGFELGLFFSIGMVALAGGAILYDTSNVLHHYPKDRYVGAALELFASVALMFWYVLRIFLSRR
jgi:hypothetical protein